MGAHEPQQCRVREFVDLRLYEYPDGRRRRRQSDTGRHLHSDRHGQLQRGHDTGADQRALACVFS